VEGREGARVIEWLSSGAQGLCIECGEWDGCHLRDCAAAELCRALGGPEETRRHVDAAWEEAVTAAGSLSFRAVT